MNLREKLKGIFSVSAASLALLQSTSEAKTKDIQAFTGDLNQRIQSQEVSTTDKLVLAPGANQEEIAKRYAAHRSHSSHSSHASHASHRSHYSSYGGGYTPSTPSAPSAPASPQYVAPESRPAAVYPKIDTNAVARKVIEWQKQRAAEGSAVSQYDWGMRLLTGDGVEKNEVQARHWLGMSAKQGHPPAIEKLKQLGPIAPQPAIATTTTQTVARMTNTLGTNAAVMLERPDTAKKPLQVLLREAAGGSSASQYELGLKYLTGDGVEKDQQKAKVFFEMAAAQGNALATSKLEQLKSGEKKN